MSRKLMITLIAAGLLGCAVSPPRAASADVAAPIAAPAADQATLRDDAVYHTQQIKTLGARQQTEIAQARADQIKFQNAATAWKNSFDDINDSVPYWIGWCICLGFKWWLFALITVFVVRMIFVYWGGPIGEFVAHLCTALLGLLTCFTTYLTNIPDNVYFRRVITAKDAKIADLNNQLQAAQLAGAAAIGTAANASGQPAAAGAVVGENQSAAVVAASPNGGGN